MIEINNLTCGYGRESILEDITLSIDMGKTYLLLGSNGIGKTTLFKTILRNADILAGSIKIGEKDIKEFSTKELAKIVSYVPQARNARYEFNVEEVIMMGRASHISTMGSPKKHDIDIVDSIIYRLELDKIRDKKFFELSGGQQQIILFGRALAQEAKFIILDEPASNLDYKNQKRLLNEISTLSKNGIGVMMSSHNPDMAMSVCERAIVINRDRHVIEGDVQDMMTDDILTSIYDTEMKVLKDNEGLMACTIAWRENDTESNI